MVFNSVAQMFCYPNAEWHYSRNWLSGNGYLKINYTGTTTINSITCQKLNGIGWVHDMLGNSTFSYTSNYYTYEVDSVVFLYMPTYNAFDTLYNYKANIGDSWLLPRHSFPNCNRCKVTVVDTGHAVIQSVNLKWLRLSANNLFDTLYQRIGTYYHFAFDYISHCPTADIQVAGPLRCYNDSQISNYKKYSGSCNYFFVPPTWLTERENYNRVILHPGLTSDILIINFQNNDYKNIELINLSGQLILTQKIDSQHLEINTENLNSGIYIIIFHSISGEKLSKKFVKP